MNWMWENVVIYVCTTVLVISLYAMSGSFHSLWGLLLLLFINISERKIKEKS